MLPICCRPYLLAAILLLLVPCTQGWFLTSGLAMSRRNQPPLFISRREREKARKQHSYCIASRSFQGVTTMLQLLKVKLRPQTCGGWGRYDAACCRCAALWWDCQVPFRFLPVRTICYKFPSAPISSPHRRKLGSPADLRQGGFQSAP